MRLLVLALLGLTLAACTPPQVDTALTAALARGANDPATWTLAAAPQRARIEAGPADLLLDAVVITGTDLRVNDARCGVTARAEITCTFGSAGVPAGRAFALPVAGTDLHATVLYHRTGGLALAKAF